MHHEPERPLTLETLLRDPLVRMVREADRVSMEEFAAILYAARQAVAARGRFETPGEAAARDAIAARASFATCVAAMRHATSARA